MELPTFEGDRVGAAFGINDNGQAVGGSGICVAFDPISQLNMQPVHALLWEKDGTMHDLGNLEGQTGSMASGINNLGQVVGSSGLYGFLWTKAKGMQPLNPLSGGFLSVALGIDDMGDAAGGSLDESFLLTAVVWENGSNAPVDLNTLVADNPSGLYLQLAEGINSKGEIVGFGSPSDDPNDIPHAFLATPIDGAGDEGSLSKGTRGSVKPVVSEAVRRLLRQRVGSGPLVMRSPRPR